MAITKAFIDAVEAQNIRKIRIMMEDSLLVDLTFREYKEMERLSANVSGLYDEHDGQAFITDSSDWNDGYMNKLMVQAIGNFSHERLAHLQEVIRYLRPINKKNTNIDKIKDQYKELVKSMYTYDNLSYILSNFNDTISKIVNKGIVKFIEDEKVESIENSDITYLIIHTNIDSDNIQKELSKLIKGKLIEFNEKIIDYKTIIESDSIGENCTKEVEKIYKKLQKLYGNTINEISNTDVKDYDKLLSKLSKEDNSSVNSTWIIKVINKILTVCEIIYLSLIQNIKDYVVQYTKLGQFYTSFANFKFSNESTIFDNVQLI